MSKDLVVSGARTHCSVAHVDTLIKEVFGSLGPAALSGKMSEASHRGTATGKSCF